MQKPRVYLIGKVPGREDDCYAAVHIGKRQNIASHGHRPVLTAFDQKSVWDWEEVRILPQGLKYCQRCLDHVPDKALPQAAQACEEQSDAFIQFPRRRSSTPISHGAGLVASAI